MATGDSVIKGALRLNTALAQGATPSADQTADVLEAINLILGSWSNDNLIQSHRITENFSTTTGVSSRTIGSGANWNTAKPVDVENIWIRDSNSVDHYIDRLDASQYAKLPAKGIDSGRPEFFYFEPIDSVTPATHAKIFFDKTTNVTETFYMISYKEFIALSASTDTILLPAAWIRALKFNLAVDIAPEFGVPVTQELALLAKDSKDHIRVLMAQNVDPATNR